MNLGCVVWLFESKCVIEKKRSILEAVGLVGAGTILAADINQTIFYSSVAGNELLYATEHLSLPFLQYNILFPNIPAKLAYSNSNPFCPRPLCIFLHKANTVCASMSTSTKHFV